MCTCIVPLKLVFFSTVCAFGSCFRMLAVNLVSDLFPPFSSFLRSLVSRNWAPLSTTLHQAFIVSNTGLHRFTEPKPKPTNLNSLQWQGTQCRRPSPADSEWQDPAQVCRVRCCWGTSRPSWRSPSGPSVEQNRFHWHTAPADMEGLHSQSVTRKEINATFWWFTSASVRPAGLSASELTH